MTDEKQKMTDTDAITPTTLVDAAPASPKSGAKRRRNILLAIVLALGAFSMYASIFYRTPSDAKYGYVRKTVRYRRWTHSLMFSRWFIPTRC